MVRRCICHDVFSCTQREILIAPFHHSVPTGHVVIRAKHDYELHVRITTLVRELLPIRVHFVDFQRVNIVSAHGIS